MANQIKRTWYLLPIIFGLVGSAIMWIIQRDDTTEESKRFIKNAWIIGLLSLLWYNIPWIILASELLE